jgi:hypothetical protein
MIGGRPRFVLSMGLPVLLVGCAAEPRGEPSPVPRTSEKTGWDAAAAEGLRLVVRGDWDDVDTSVAVGVSRGEAAVLSSTADAEHPGRKLYTLLSILDERGTLTARRLPEDGNTALPGPGDAIEFTCRFAPFRNPERERTILVQTRRRLRDLAGVDYRPIR